MDSFVPRLTLLVEGEALVEVVYEAEVASREQLEPRNDCPQLTELRLATLLFCKTTRLF